MSQAVSVAVAGVDREDRVGAPVTVSLKGTTRGLEIHVAGAGTGPQAALALGARLTELLAEAPGFFAGSDARVAFDGALPTGALACLEQVAAAFALNLVEIAPASQRPKPYAAIVRQVDEVRGQLADGTGPIAPAVEAELAAAVSIADGPDEVGETLTILEPASRDDEILALAEELANEMAAEMAAKQAAELAKDLAQDLAKDLAAKQAAALAEELSDLKARAMIAALPPGPKFVIGPVRSGVIVDHTGHVVIVGDVNPGAEVRAEGNIIVLGRLRGVAHAAIGREAGCIVALSLAPQQLRIGRSVARAGAGDRPSDRAEIAYLTGETIVVERFTGRLPSGLAASM